MANTKITTNVIADDAITTEKIADDVALGGNPTTTTQSAGNNTTRVATTAFVTTALSSISSDSLSDADSDTKIQVEESSDEDKIRFDTGGTERMIIDDSGKVGIGTTAPDDYWSTASNLVVKQSSGNGGISIVTGTSEVGQLYFADGTSGDAQYRGWLNYSHSDDKMALATAASIRMTILSDGKVGIGTTSPDQTLQVAGNIRIPATGGKIAFGSAGATPGDYLMLQDVSSGTPALSFVQDSSTKFVIDGVTGNVGIGTTSPDQMLHVSKGSAGSIDSHSTAAITIEDNDHVTLQFLTPNDKQQNIFFGDVQDNAHGIIRYDHSTTKLHLGTDGDPNKFILDNGKVAIGTTSFISNAALTVDGGDMMVHGANNSAGISDLLPGYTRGDYGVFYSTANHIYFGVGSSYVAYISGSNGTYNVSDERLKENINTLTGTLDKVKQLRGVSFTWKDTETKGTDTTIGLIAQEVETIYPELVGDGGLPKDTDGNDALKSVNYAHLTAVLIEAVKELSTKLEAAEARIKTLEDA